MARGRITPPRSWGGPSKNGNGSGGGHQNGGGSGVSGHDGGTNSELTDAARQCIKDMVKSCVQQFAAQVMAKNGNIMASQPNSPANGETAASATPMIGAATAAPPATVNTAAAYENPFNFKIDFSALGHGT